MVETQHIEGSPDTPRVLALGTVRLRRLDTNEIILVPRPSADPNDPLNWYVSHPNGSA